MAEIQIARIGTETIIVPIVGTMPLIVSNFSEKAKRQMLDAQQGRKSPKMARDPETEYQAAFYRTKEGYGFPVTAFKQATVGAARFFGKDVRMTELRQFVFMRGQLSENDRQALVEIHGTPRMREDVVRLGGVSRTPLRAVLRVHRNRPPRHQARRSLTDFDMALHGPARSRTAWLCKAWRGSHGLAGLGVAGQGPARLGRHGPIR